VLFRSDAATTATFTLSGQAGQAVEVIDENRSLTSKAGVFQGAFEPWAVHLYRIGPSVGTPR